MTTYMKLYDNMGRYMIYMTIYMKLYDNIWKYIIYMTIYEIYGVDYMII